MAHSSMFFSNNVWMQRWCREISNFKFVFFAAGWSGNFARHYAQNMIMCETQMKRVTLCRQGPRRGRQMYLQPVSRNSRWEWKIRRNEKQIDMWSSLRGRCGCSCEHLEGRLLLFRLLTALCFQFPWEPTRALNLFSVLIWSVSCFQYLIQGVYGLSAYLVLVRFNISHMKKLKRESGLSYKSKITSLPNKLPIFDIK